MKTRLASILCFLCCASFGVPLEVQLDNEQANIQSSLAVLSSAQESSESDVDLSQVISLLTSLDSQMTNLRTAIGQTPTRSFGWLMGQMQSNLTAIKNATTSLLSLSNLVDNISTETTTIRETLEGLLDYVDSIFFTLASIDGTLHDFYSDWGDFAVINTNFLGDIVDALKNVVVQIGDITNIVCASGSEGGGFDVTISGGIDIRNWPDEYKVVHPVFFGWSGSLLEWVEDVSGVEELDPDFDFASTETPIVIDGDDFYDGVLQFLQSQTAALCAMQQSLARIVLELKSGEYDTTDTQNFVVDTKNEWQSQETRVESSIENHRFVSTYNSFNQDMPNKIAGVFGSDLSLSVSGDTPQISVSGGTFMGFQYETFTFVFDFIPSNFATILRSWFLFLYSATLIFLVFRIVPWGTVKFATLLYYIMQINKKV